ncbi:MAG TPA: hypothetical protein VF396_10840, partial [Bradyrhizobium sp.]
IGGIRRKPELRDQMNKGTSGGGHPEPRGFFLDQKNRGAQKFTANDRSVANALIKILFGIAPQDCFVGRAQRREHSCLIFLRCHSSSR